MANMKELREKQAKLVAQARAALDEMDGADETRAAELEKRHDTIMAEYDQIDKQLERIERLNAAEARASERAERAAAARRPTPDDGQTGAAEPATAPDPRAVFTRAMTLGLEFMDPEERQMAAAMQANISDEMRAQAAGTSTAGGFTVPEGFLPEITKSMALYGPMLDGNITRVIRTATGAKLPWPTVDDTANVGALLAENTAVAEQDVTFGQKSLDAYTYTSKLVRVSLQLLRDSAFNMEAFLAEIFGERIGRAANTDLTVGDGASKPNGIVTASSLGKTAALNSAITADELIDLQHSVDPAHRSAPGARWMFHDSTLAAIRKLRDGQGNYLWQAADVRSGAPAQILGHPFSVNNAMPQIASQAKPIVFGDFQKYIVRQVEDFTMLRLNERYADFLQAGFLAFNAIDGELADTAAVKHLAMAL